jgi:hypothetical protein
VLLLSDAPGLPASYANIVRNFADAVAPRGVEVAFGSLQHMGWPLKFEFNGRSYAQYGCNPPHRITDAVNEFDPDVVIHVRDPVVHIPRLFPQGNYSVRSQVQNGAAVATWVPVQHEVSPWDYVAALYNEYSVIMPFTAAGADNLGNLGIPRDRLDPLQLGVSASYSDPAGPVATGYGREGVPIVMSVGLGGQDRKAFPVLMRGYRHALAADPTLDLDFYLHTSMFGAFDLPEHARMMGVDGHFILPRGYDPGIGLTEADLASRYRRATAYASVGTGEGWDMPLSEACALGRVVILPDEANRREVAGDYRGPKLVVRTFPMPRTTSWERLIDPSDLALALLQVKTLKPDPEAGRDYYSRHSWATVADRFMEIAERRGWK